MSLIEPLLAGWRHAWPADRRERLALLAVLAWAAVLRVLFLREPIRFDEAANALYYGDRSLLHALGLSEVAKHVIDALHQEDASMDAVFQTRYGDGAGSGIEVRTDLEGPFVVVRVLDKGPGLGDEDPEQLLKNAKVVIATDADVDGMHIRNLLLTYFLRYCEDLVLRGHVFILATPIFRVRNKKDTIYCYSDEERQRALHKLGKTAEITWKF